MNILSRYICHTQYSISLLSCTLCTFKSLFIFECVDWALILVSFFHEFSLLLLCRHFSYVGKALWRPNHRWLEFFDILSSHLVGCIPYVQCIYVPSSIIVFLVTSILRNVSPFSLEFIESSSASHLKSASTALGHRRMESSMAHLARIPSILL